MEFGAIIVSSIVAMIIGSIWYSPLLFGKMWMRFVGFTKSEKEKGKKEMPKLFMMDFVATLLMALSFNFLLILSEAGELYVAFVVWLGFILAPMFSQTLWEQKKWPVFLITVAYRLVAILAMAIVFQLFN